MSLPYPENTQKLITAVTKALYTPNSHHFLQLDTQTVISISENNDNYEELLENIEEQPDNFLAILPMSSSGVEEIPQKREETAFLWLQNNGLL